MIWRALIGALIVACSSSGCATTSTKQREVTAYLFTDGFVGSQHEFVRRDPFSFYTIDVAEDACTTYIRSAAKEMASATQCTPMQYNGSTSPMLKDTVSVCTTLARNSHRTEYCWVTEKAGVPWSPGMVTIDREATPMKYGPVYSEKK